MRIKRENIGKCLAQHPATAAAKTHLRPGAALTQSQVPGLALPHRTQGTADKSCKLSENCLLYKMGIHNMTPQIYCKDLSLSSVLCGAQLLEVI